MPYRPLLAEPLASLPIPPEFADYPLVHGEELQAWHDQIRSWQEENTGAIQRSRRITEQYRDVQEQDLLNNAKINDIALGLSQALLDYPAWNGEDASKNIGSLLAELPDRATSQSLVDMDMNTSIQLFAIACLKSHYQSYLQFEARPLSMLAMFDSFFDSPLAFAALVLILLDRGISIEEMQRGGLFNRYFIQNVYNSDVLNKTYALIRASVADSSQLDCLKHVTGVTAADDGRYVSIRGFENIGLDGSKHASHRALVVTEPGLFLLTPSHDNFAALHALFGNDWITRVMTDVAKPSAHQDRLLQHLQQHLREQSRDQILSLFHLLSTGIADEERVPALTTLANALSIEQASELLIEGDEFSWFLLANKQALLASVSDIDLQTWVAAHVITERSLFPLLHLATHERFAEQRDMIYGKAFLLLLDRPQFMEHAMREPAVSNALSSNAHVKACARQKDDELCTQLIDLIDRQFLDEHGMYVAEQHFDRNKYLIAFDGWTSTNTRRDFIRQVGLKSLRTPSDVHVLRALILERAITLYAKGFNGLYPDPMMHFIFNHLKHMNVVNEDISEVIAGSNEYALVVQNPDYIRAIQEYLVRASDLIVQPFLIDCLTQVQHYDEHRDQAPWYQAYVGDMPIYKHLLLRGNIEPLVELRLDSAFWIRTLHTPRNNVSNERFIDYIAKNSPEHLATILTLIPEAQRYDALSYDGQTLFPLEYISAENPALVAGILQVLAAGDRLKSVMSYQDGGYRMHIASRALPEALRELDNDEQRLLVVREFLKIQDHRLTIDGDSINQISLKLFVSVVAVLDDSESILSLLRESPREGGDNLLLQLIATPGYFDQLPVQFLRDYYADLIRMSTDCIPLLMQHLSDDACYPALMSTVAEQSMLASLFATDRANAVLATAFLRLEENNRLAIIDGPFGRQIQHDWPALEANRRAYYLLSADCYLRHLRTTETEQAEPYARITQEKIRVVEEARNRLLEGNEEDAIQNFQNDLRATDGSGTMVLTKRRDTWLTWFLKCVGVTFSLGFAYNSLFNHTRGDDLLNQVGAAPAAGA